MMNTVLTLLAFTIVTCLSGLHANALVTEQVARSLALAAARPRLTYLQPGQFLSIQRSEELEQKLAALVGGLAGSEYIYKLNPEGDEIEEHAVVHHILTDVEDPVSIVVVSPLSGRVYLLRGFKESTADFNKLMSDLKVKILDPNDAEALVSFYREINPERRQLTPATSLLDLKQAAERQCQDIPFSADERSFNAWWNHAKPLYSDVSFRQTASRSRSGYAVEWIVLSSPGAGLCGGAPLRVQCDVTTDGQVGGVAFTQLKIAEGKRE